MKKGISKWIGLVSVWTALHAQTVRLEAENGVLTLGTGTGTSNSVRTTTPMGFSGTGYVGNFENIGDKVSLSTNLTAGTYEVRVGYASPTGAKTIELVVNGATTQFQIAQTATDTWSSVLVGRFDLASGNNTLVIQPNWTWFKIDYLEIEPVRAALCEIGTKCEAEASDLQGPSIGTAIPGYSGTGYAAGFTDATHYIEFPVDADVNGRFALEIAYACEWGGKTATLDVNGSAFNISLDSTGAMWKIRNRDTLNLLKGQNSLKIKANWTHFNIDYIRLTPAGNSAALVKPPKVLSDPQADDHAKALLSWLVDQYGIKTLSGQQNDYVTYRPTFAEVDSIFSKSGERPAILGGDYMEFSNSRLQPGKGTKPVGYTEQFIDSALAGYLITMMWHWGAPMDNMDGTGDQAWYKNFYTNATNFDLAFALANPTSPQYQGLLEDIDSVAVELQKFEDAGIPVLWRPLHEADGTWFWWGAAGAENLKALWRLMWDRMTNHHGLHNLIWVFTDGGKVAWYPGDDVVDIVGADIYSNAGDPTVTVWESLKTRFNGRKLLALTEFGGVADLGKMHSYDVWWSYFVSWTGPYGAAGYTQSELTGLYGSSAFSNARDVNLQLILAGGSTQIRLKQQPYSPSLGSHRFDLMGRLMNK